LSQSVSRYWHKVEIYIELFILHISSIYVVELINILEHIGSIVEEELLENSNEHKGAVSNYSHATLPHFC